MSEASPRRYPPEIRRQAIQMVGEVVRADGSEWAAITEAARTLGVGSPESVRRWVRQAEVDRGDRPGVATDQSGEWRRERRGRAELNRAEAIHAAASMFFAAELNPSARMIEFVRLHQGHREPGGLRWGVEPICAVLSANGLPISPSTYYEHVDRAPSRRQMRDEGLKDAITAVHVAQDGTWGARKIWVQLSGQGTPVARCTVERLMRELGLRGVPGAR